MHTDTRADPRCAARTDERAGRLRRVAVLALAVTLLATAVAAAVFWTSGGRWFVMRTPSMGTAAPVGALVLTSPTQLSSLRVGDIIAYHPPTDASETYTHRVVSVGPQGVRTRGDINGARDPWTLAQHDVIGRATVVPYVGWLLRALPLLLVGGGVIWGATATWLPPLRRGPVRMAGTSILFSVSAVLLKPFVNVVQLETQSTAHGAYIRMVSTGLLPIRLSAADGHGQAAPVDLSRAGTVAVAHFTGGHRGMQYELQTHLHLALWQWALLAVFSLSPLLWTLLVGFRASEPTPLPA